MLSLLRNSPCILAACLVLLTSCKESPSETQSSKEENSSSHPVTHQTRSKNKPDFGPIRRANTNPKQATSTHTSLYQTTTEKLETTTTNQPPLILKDFSQIKIRPNTPTPKLGDKIYTMDNLPKDACGEYWILEKDGTVNMLAICTHPEGAHEAPSSENQ